MMKMLNVFVLMTAFGFVNLEIQLIEMTNVIGVE